MPFYVYLYIFKIKYSRFLSIFLKKGHQASTPFSGTEYN